MRRLNKMALFPILSLVILIYALSGTLGVIPPLGLLLNPFTGAVRHSDDRQLNSSQTLREKELKDSVTVFLDERKVPHIYAGNTADLWFAQGYVAASLRLWQMDFMARAAAGRLSEIFDQPQFLTYDRNQRRLGIPQAAVRSLALIENDPAAKEALTAYSKGVNAYIRGLDDRSIPLEYKLLDYRPEPWNEYKSVLILKSMAENMTGYNEDMFMSKMILALGEQKFNRLFPDFPATSSPVMYTPERGHSTASFQPHLPGYLDYSFLASGPVPDKNTYNPRLGSNSWAVSGQKTRSGSPILACDPHLGLSLPSTWLEMQLCAPAMNVYGVSIPGTPSIIIGFNRNIAWGITNGADDVKDWYKLKISSDYTKYFFDGKWLPLDSRIEKIERKGRSPFYDTVYSTIHGPIVTDKRFPGRDPDYIDLALRWELQNPSDEFLTFIELNQARNYREYKAAISHFACPIQNFSFACRDNTIAINHQGKMAVRWSQQGKFILDGTKKDHLPSAYIPADSLPQLLDPDSHYVLSANQHPTRPDYPYYYHGYFSETRANRIRSLLESKNQLDIAAMEAIQLDNTNGFALDALPLLLQNVHTGQLNATQQHDLTAVAGWKGTYDQADTLATLYEHWWEAIRALTWDKFNVYAFYRRPPDDQVLLQLIRNQPDDSCFDQPATARRENAGDVITGAFITACKAIDDDKKKGRRNWGDNNRVDLMHLSNLPAFSEMQLRSGGNPEAIDAISANWGPSWRMIVQLGDTPTAYGIYPGGQSGDPASRYYERFVGDWNRGHYYPLHLFTSFAEAAKASTATWFFIK